jgi:hypothetical protein
MCVSAEAPSPRFQVPGKFQITISKTGSTTPTPGYLDVRYRDLQLSALKAYRMSRFKTVRHAGSCLPARGEAVARVIPRCRIEPQSGNYSKCVTFARVDGYPPSVSPLSKSTQIGRTHRRPDQPCSTQHVRDGSRAIIPAVGKGAMPPAIPIWLGPELVGCPNRPLYRNRRGFRSSGHSSPKASRVPQNGGSGARKR